MAFGNRKTATVPASEELLPQLIDAAIAWSIRIHHDQPSAETRRDFERWLAASPLHQQAWRRIESLDDGFSRIPKPLVSAALRRVSSSRDEVSLQRRRALKLLLLGGVMLGAGLGVREWMPWQRLLADVGTGAGEQRRLELADGSRLVLNTDSAIRIDLEGEQRLINLLRGELHITTGADNERLQKRPFLVTTPFGVVQARGTQFLVRLTDDAARVSVFEGAVNLTPAAGEADLIAAGESRLLSRTAVLPAAPLAFAESDWLEGILTGRNLRLADLLEELSRYRPGRISCDERAAELRVSGVYHLDDIDRVLDFLRQTQPINMTYRTRYWIHVSAADRTD